MAKHHENYLHLIWTLAKTDFTLRYHGSVLGYLWAILKPLFIFAILNFVFSSIFNPRGIGNEYYSLGLLVSIMMFTFFFEGTMAGMSSLLSKSQLITKIYVPRWTIIVASSLNAVLVFAMNLIVVVIFFIAKPFTPSLLAILAFLFSCLLIYVLILAFSFIAAPLYVKFRDLLMIWEVMGNALFYATPIIYPLSMMPVNIQRILLINPLAFVIHFTKESLFANHFADPWQSLTFIVLIGIFFGFSLFAYKKISHHMAENM